MPTTDTPAEVVHLNTCPKCSAQSECRCGATPCLFAGKFCDDCQLAHLDRSCECGSTTFAATFQAFIGVPLEVGTGAARVLGPLSVDGEQMNSDWLDSICCAECGAQWSAEAGALHGQPGGVDLGGVADLLPAVTFAAPLTLEWDSDEPPAIEVELVESIARGEDFATVRVTLPSGYSTDVTASNYARFGGSRQPQVNWKSIGPCDPDDAIAYAKAILAAAALAQRLNSESEEG